ncbi:MAG: hypothetical protein A3H42_02885 [Deltaproteobacteria bacterium RIFCSPLOWO2_02_FULL_46_8]|nr:MAG: hypothetical protein A3H42_02885 [Deltaproteobacteria bacterium RIFCSPLOWO2_02_FULL_46_8]
MRLRLGEILVQKGLVTKEDVDAALKEQQKSRKPIGEILEKMGKVTEKNVLLALGEQLHIEFVDLKKTAISPEAVKALPVKLVTYYKIMPVKREGNVLTLAVNDPLNNWPLDDIEVNVGLHPRVVLACRKDIAEAIGKHYGVGAETVEKILTEDEDSVSISNISIKEEISEISGDSESSEDATVVKLVNQILEEAVRRGATDIHVEPARGKIAVRYRVDGVLSDAHLPMDIRYLAPAILSRIKIMAGMDIVEKRLPQDGRSRIQIGPKEFDLRVSSMPARHGEDLAIRLLPSKAEFRFENLGMQEEALKIFEQLIAKPHGIVFVTGPTGSGKSTTLYTCLSRINSRERKIITVEDPVEYEIGGITQIQANAAVGLTFARALRNILRHDPDVIMVGEVRDAETAKIAIQAALTGHLVFSTLHTNDAASGVARLVDMGVDPFLIASSVEAFVAQRLVRLICPACKEKVSAEESHQWLAKVSALNAKRPSKTGFFRGRGCEECGNTGYAGRTAIYEFLPVGEAVKSLILKRASAGEIKKTAIEKGMTTLVEDGWSKVLLGLTTPEEVARVTEIGIE